MDQQAHLRWGGTGGRQGAAPRWFETVCVLAAGAVAGVGLVGLVLAFAGAYSTPLALLVGLPLAGAGAWVFARARDGGTGGWRRSAPAVAAAGVALLFAVSVGWAPSQHVLVDRDPGGYGEVARWLSLDGGLTVEADQGGLEAGAGLRFSSATVYDMGEGDLEFQFNHLTSVVMAAAYDLGGHHLLFRSPALVAAAGLLCLYAVAVRATGRPWLALLAPGAFALSAPLRYAGGDTFSEPTAFLLLWGALLALLAVHRRPSALGGVLGGALLGALVASRIDAMLYLAVAVPLCAASVVVAGDSQLCRRRLVAYAWAAGAAAVGVAVGTYDLEALTGMYATHLGDQKQRTRLLLAGSVVATAVAAGLWAKVPAVRRTVTRWAPRLATGAAVVLVLGLLVAWLVRPEVQTTTGRARVGLVEGIQARDGLAVDGRRRYYEDSLWWMAWYLGVPALVAAIAGFALAVHGALKARVRSAAVAVAALGLVVGAAYWWQASIVPDQLWATRRFVPAVLPALTVMAAYAVGRLLDWSRPSQPVRLGAASLATAALLVVPLLVTWPIREGRAQHGYLGVVREACDLIGPDASVVVTGAYTRMALPQALRGWCGVPVASTTPDTTTEQLLAVAESVEAAGRRLVLVDSESSLLTAVEGLVVPIGSTGVAVSDREIDYTLDRPPHGYRPPQSFGLYVVELPAP